MSTPKPLIAFGYPTEAHGRIPSFTSVEEEAGFWDTHDFTDFEEELESFELVVEPDLSSSLTLVLATNDREELDRRAEEFGVAPSTLVPIWVKERLHKEAS
ncbi:MAG TPA: CopG family antitoxin [Thermomicrobiales bacterium]|nr:CopG family antitoxin [Thermomicrobiales bacterium]